MFTKTTSLTSAALVTLLLGTVQIGCAAGRPLVNARAKAIATSSQALSTGSLIEVNGLYGGSCAQGAGGSWSVAVDGYSGPLDNAPLAVVMNDSSCVLTVTELKADQTYATPTPIDMSDSYQDQAAAFAPSGGTYPVSFYANAKLSSADFSSDFQIQLVYSDDPNLSSASAMASYVTQSATATSGSVPAPDYTLDMTGIVIQTDASNVVQVASGSASLAIGLIAGQSFAIDPGTLPTDTDPTYAQIDTAYLEQTASSFTSVDDSGNATIDASAFSLGGMTLSTTLNLIVANQSSGVRSYEVFQVTINSAGSVGYKHF